MKETTPQELAVAFESFSRASRSLEQAHGALLGRVEDLTRRLNETESLLRESQEERRRLEDLAERRSRLEAMGRMAAEIAHEIRNPLGSLELTASLLRDDLDDDPSRRELAVSILDGIRALTRVTGNLLSFTRSVSPRPEKLDAAAVLARTKDLVAPVCEAQGIELRIASPPGMTVEADPEHIQQILLNLVQNALEAMGSGGTVTIAARPLDGGVEIAVTDTGCGLDADTLARVFDPFFTTKERGTGLGLSVSHRLAEAQGARLELSSEPGRGTTAKLVFGAAVAAPRPRPYAAPPKPVERIAGEARMEGSGAPAGAAARPTLVLRELAEGAL